MADEDGRRGGPTFGSAVEVLAVFLRLGLTSFGGPVAHLGFIHDECVDRRRWLDEDAYADVVALCQFLPGPASSQVCVSLGIMRAGLPGGVAAWLGFTLPSAVALVLFAEGIGLVGNGQVGDVAHAAWLRGLGSVAVAVVAKALWSMAQRLCPDRRRGALAIGAAAAVLAVPSPLAQGAVIAAGAALGRPLVGVADVAPQTRLHAHIGRPAALLALALFALLLVALPAMASLTGNHGLDLASRFYRAGALVFGGGHVVLPLLQDAVVPPGWIGEQGFLAGYGATQAVPGPLFAFAAYLGAAMSPGPNGWAGALLCLTAIYLPSFLLLVGVLPFWDGLRRRGGVRAAMTGVNATVVGLLLAAFIAPVLSRGIDSARDAVVALGAFGLLSFRNIPVWIVVIAGALAG
ncbi:chromate efflux transporter [Lichenibacterium minor]|uniref:Chromate efflux transporter n=1 Tax=Lichenibacterium minor TaxID=2316528 RepID=A0A4Q2U4Z3_9HYPH|nr:chromate efflux transporter [Lichenibacterium minor]RYC31350.1 chromate efflux transporter [Lichenibacterium minor]